MITTPRYRIGNDMTILWAINNKDGSPFNMEGKEVHLFITHRYGREEVRCTISTLPDGTVNNVIRWDFAGDDQKVLGPYTLTAKIFTSEDMKLIKKDICEAFELVGVSCMECEDDDNAVINDGGELVLSSRLDIYRFGIPKITIGINGNWHIDGVDSGVSAIGGGPGLVTRLYQNSDFGKDFEEESVIDTFNAYAINELAKRITALENAEPDDPGDDPGDNPGGGSLPPEQVDAIEKLLKWFSFDDERGLIKANYGLYSIGSITAGGRGASSSGDVATFLYALKDVSLSDLTDGQSLVYDALSGMWVNRTISGGGGSADVTYQSVVDALGYTPFDSDAFTKANIKNALGIKDWALASSKPSYSWSEIGSKPTTLAGYGITDAMVLSGYESNKSADDILTQGSCGIYEGMTNTPDNSQYGSMLIFGPKAGMFRGQLYIEHSGKFYVRARSSSLVNDSYWRPWREILDNSNYSNFVYGKDQTYSVTQIENRLNNTVIYSDYIDITNNDAARHIGYGYASIGWHGSGPAMSFGTALYNLRMQLAIERTDTPRLMVSQVYNGTAYGWAELLTKEGLAKMYLTTAGYKCYDQMVLHKINGGDTFVNYGGAVNESNSLQLYYGASFVVSLKGQSVMTMANNGNARFYKDLSVDGTLISNAIYGYVPEGGTYQRYRLVSSGDTMYLQVGAQDGTATTGKLAISGINVATLISLTIYSQQTLFSGAVQVNGTSRFVSLATFDKGIKIGDATLSWDSAAGMLKTDKGFYSTGAITAGGKSSAGQSPSTSVASTEWYNIKTKRMTDKSTIATDIYNIIENFNERLLDDQYRIVLMTFKRKSGQGYGWRIPMFSPRYNADTGVIVHEDTPCAIDWNNTWWPVQSSETLTLNQTGMNITDIINIEATGTRFQRSNSKKIRIGFAIFKKTLDAEGNNVGTWGWQRVSNIAEIMLYYAANRDITMIRVIE